VVLVEYNYLNLLSGHPAPKANGLAEQMDKFSTYFGLKLGEYIELYLYS
jgi:hypothetical protein